MRSIVHDYVVQVLDACESDRSGSVADYIPELKAADPERFGLALATLDGELYTAGHDDVEFSIQSISKPFVYALALEDAGFSQVMAHIDVEPSGNAFNSLSLKPESGRPYNPMINAGAITAHSLVAGTGDERVERILARFSALADRSPQSRHRPHAARLRHPGRGPGAGGAGLYPAVLDPRHGAGPGVDGGDPGEWRRATGHRGAADGAAGSAAGAERDDELRHVRRGRGLDHERRHPGEERGGRRADRGAARAGRAGGLLAARSIVKAANRQQLSEGCSQFEVQLQGALRFAGVERVVRDFARRTPEGRFHIVIDCSQVFSADRVARVMLYELTQRLHDDGHRVTMLIPGGPLFADHPGDIGTSRVFVTAEPEPALFTER